jgi:hypothetical protein
MIAALDALPENDFNTLLVMTEALVSDRTRRS